MENVVLLGFFLLGEEAAQNLQKNNILGLSSEIDVDKLFCWSFFKFLKAGLGFHCLLFLGGDCSVLLEALEVLPKYILTLISCLNLLH